VTELFQAERELADRCWLLRRLGLAREMSEDLPHGSEK
jgi:hypothetical protein